ncbi:MAG: BppU family phage baseplate upper protein [Vagococcus sp.]
MTTNKKWIAALSTTEQNHIGVIQVRKGNINSETWYIQIVQNGAELNFIEEGIKKVYFCTKFANKYVVEQEAKIIDAQKGHIKYVMNEFDMQKIGLQQAYFKFEDGEGNYRGTTQSFTYRIIESIDSSCAEMGSYVARLEELLKLYSVFFENQSQSWIDFVTENREILESIDPEGKILLELIEARDGESSLNMRLKRDYNKIYEILVNHVPHDFKFILTHDSEYQPDVKVTSYRNALGVEKNGLATGPMFGGETIFNVPTELSYDRKKITVEMPKKFELKGSISIPTNDILLIIDGVDVLCFKVTGANVIGGSS